MQLPNSSYCDPIFDLAVNTVAVLACKLMQLPSRPPYMHTCCCSVSVLVGERGGKRMEYREGKGGGRGQLSEGKMHLQCQCPLNSYMLMEVDG